MELVMDEGQYKFKEMEHRIGGLEWGLEVLGKFVRCPQNCYSRCLDYVKKLQENFQPDVAAHKDDLVRIVANFKET